MNLIHTDLAVRFAEACNRWGVTDEDDERMTPEEADLAIQAVCETLASQDGRWPNLGHADVWHEVEALVLDRFGADPDAFTPDERNHP
ncbi:MAG TPA: hypothetical protein VIT65_10730 [Microlunatus sp.]